MDSVKICHTVFTNIAAIGEERGLLVCIEASDLAPIVGCLSANKQSKSLSLAEGIEVGGVYVTVSFPDDINDVEETGISFLESTPIQDTIKGNSAFILAISKEDETQKALYIFNFESKELELLTIEPTELSPLDSMIALRLQGEMNLSFEIGSNEEESHNNLLGEIDYIKERVAIETAAYRMTDSDVILLNTPDARNNAPCHKLVTGQKDHKLPHETAVKCSHFSKGVLNFRLLLQQAGKRSDLHCATCAPVIHQEHREFTWTTLPIRLDCLAFIPPTSRQSVIPSLLSSAINSQLDAVYNTLLSLSSTGTCSGVTAYHFWPSTLDFPFTVVYPDHSTEQELVTERHNIHAQCGLPTDRPLVRRGNAVNIGGERDNKGYPVNPHIGLRPSPVRGGSEHVVSGSYDYHHYMQDHMDDSGWGCAYRSLQTITSWLRLQAYTNQTPPTHTQIQQALVDVGDKDEKFVGSKQWIGSTEVSYVLDHLFNVSSKILHVSTGAELASKGRDLAHHFDTQGTPIMIGGGVRAHTILGVDWNEVTGDISFLILDPHYTGGEDLRVVQNKGWCGWKGPDFWVQNVYYNLCMPQRPNEI